MRKQKYTPLPPDTEKKVLGVFTRDPVFYRTFFPLMFVIVLQQLAALAVNMADNLMLGRYSELSLSGATLVNQLQFTLQQIAAGIGMGIVVLASQYWGQRRTEPIKKIISIGVKFGFVVGLIFFAAAQLIPTELLSLFTNDQAVVAEGARYLRVICWTYLIFAVSNSLMYSLQSVETAAIGTVMSVSTIIINVALNSCLIYGSFGAPELGVVGAAVATLVSRTVELLIIVGYVLLADKKLRMKLTDLLRFDFTYLKDYVKVALPIAVSGMLWGVAQAAQTAVLGHISAAVIAANSIAVVVFQIFAVFGMACANASSVVIGKTVGRGDLHLVKPYSKTIQAILLIIGVVFGGLAGDMPRHPSQLYEALLEGVVIFAVLYLLSRRMPPRPRGTFLGTFLVMYGCFRFLVEFVREPDAQLGYLWGGWLTMGQLLSVPLILVGAGVLVYALVVKKPQKGLPEMKQSE